MLAEALGTETPGMGAATTMSPTFRATPEPRRILT